MNAIFDSPVSTCCLAEHPSVSRQAGGGEDPARGQGQLKRILADEDCGCDVYSYGDRLMPIVPIPEVEVEDILALLDTGAYQGVSMSNFNAIPRPASVLVTGDRTSVIRQGESEEDVLRRDRIPERLRREGEMRAVTREL